MVATGCAVRYRTAVPRGKRNRSFTLNSPHVAGYRLRTASILQLLITTNVMYSHRWSPWPANPPSACAPALTPGWPLAPPCNSPGCARLTPSGFRPILQTVDYRKRSNHLSGEADKFNLLTCTKQILKEPTVVVVVVVHRLAPSSI